MDIFWTIVGLIVLAPIFLSVLWTICEMALFTFGWFAEIIYKIGHTIFSREKTEWNWDAKDVLITITLIICVTVFIMYVFW